MNNYIVYKACGRLKLTHEANYNAYIRNASQEIDVNNFANFEAIRDYLVREWNLMPAQIINKTEELNNV